jgi:hypothetical protein
VSTGWRWSNTAGVVIALPHPTSPPSRAFFAPPPPPHAGPLFLSLQPLDKLQQFSTG